MNGLSVEGKQHAEVVAAIKAGGDDTTLLVVDPETDAFFKKCRVMPNAEHLTGTSTKHKVYNCLFVLWKKFSTGFQQLSLSLLPLGGV